MRAALFAIAFAGCSNGSDIPDYGPPIGDSGVVRDAVHDVPAATDASHPPFPQLAAPFDPVFDNVNLVTIVTDGDPQGSTYTSFGDSLATGTWWNDITTVYGLGRILTNTNVVGPAITDDAVGDLAVQGYIHDLIVAGSAPVADGTRIYVLYLPPSATLIYNDRPNTDCSQIVAYHQRFLDNAVDSYAAVQQCAIWGDTAVDISTQAASHEIAEAASDPNALDGWVVAGPTEMPWIGSVWAWIDGTGFAEMGDLCGQTRIQEGSFSFQRIWSNPGAATGGDPCIPREAGPYFSVSTPQEWYAASAGTPVDIPITGWSTGSRDDWILETVTVYESPGMALDVAVDDVNQEPWNGMSVDAMNVGGSATLHVSITSAPSGSFVVVDLLSIPFDDTGIDYWHRWPVGVYVM